MDSVQAFIHKLEEGAGARYIKVGAIALLMIGMIVGYNWRCFRNLGTIEGMDAAQVGRNLSEGKGFSTLFVRPFSVYLLTNHAGLKAAASSTEAPKDSGQLKTIHPDVSNPPLYPLLVAGLWKVLPSWWAITETDTGAPLWNKDGRFYWYPSDFYLAVFNQLLLLLTVWLIYRLASKVFDARVALLTVLLVLCTELLWQFTITGLPTNLLMAIFAGLCLCLWTIESGARENAASANRLGWLSALAGLLVGLAAMTRYSLLALIVPVVFFLAMFSGQRRYFNAALAAGVFLVIITPWLIRNNNLTGTPFGTATYAYLETTQGFPREDLPRSLGPNLGKFHMGMFWRKVIANTRTLVVDDLPNIGGTWVTGFFLVSLLLSFRNPGISRLKYFVVACVGLFGMLQVVGKTHLSKDTPVLNSENLLVLTTPLLILFGVALYRVLRDQLKVPSPEIRLVVDVAFVVTVSLPMIFAMWPPRVDPRQYPPYYPPLIQRVSGWMGESELMMSDIPWAVAWYGKRQCMWITTNPAEQYFAIEDDMKPIKALYLTPRMTDAPFISGLADTMDRSWGNFIAGVAIMHEIPKAFPLQNMPETFPMPQQIFLTDRVRWQKPKPPGQ